MAYVVCEPCRDCKYTDCVVVCPTECFYQDEEMLYIDPEHCIDCGACVPECPVEAIFAEDAVPAQWTSYVQLNRDRTRELIALGTARVLEKQEPQLGEACGGPR
jgi:ferredoxin